MESAHYSETLGKLALILYFWIIVYVNIGFCWHQGLSANLDDPDERKVPLNLHRSSHKWPLILI
jgi:hypothetical protein